MSEMEGQNLRSKNLGDCCTFKMMIAEPPVNQNSARETLANVSRLQPVFLAATVFKLAGV